MQPVDLARPQEHEQLPRAVEAHRRDAALLELDPPAGEVVHHLGEIRLVADDEHAVAGRRELTGGADVEARLQRLVLDRLDLERLTGEDRGLQGADLRAREDGLERHLERRERAARGAGLVLAALGEAPVVVGPRVVRLGLAVAQEPELVGHRRGN